MQTYEKHSEGERASPLSIGVLIHLLHTAAKVNQGGLRLQQGSFLHIHIFRGTLLDLSVITGTPLTENLSRHNNLENVTIK